MKIMDDLEQAILTACLLEATARKPGNVHPLARFDDCDWGTFCESTQAIAPVLARGLGLGQAVLNAVAATRARVGRNTNLGMILLLAPLSAAKGALSPEGVEDILQRTTAEDCRFVYEAIRLARPGGLGRTNQADVHDTPTISLVEAMRLAADRDLVARQYVTDFAAVFRISNQFSATELPALEREIITAYLEQLACQPDSLIARKCGVATAKDASKRARLALDRGQLRELDEWLRGDGNRRNPGTTADLIAAGLFVAIRAGRIPSFRAGEILEFGERIQRAKSPMYYI